MCVCQVVVYAKTPSQQRGNRTLLCFPSEFTEYVFCVNASGRKWDISKRFKDFIKFEAKLTKHFSDEELAGREPLPEKNYFLSNSPSYVEHRRWRLEMYINSLAHCPVVAHSETFKDFLGCDSGQRTYGNEVSCCTVKRDAQQHACTHARTHACKQASTHARTHTEKRDVQQ